MITITKEDFAYAIGQKPVQDDMERVNCPKAGQIAHMQCGWCYTCNMPVFMCICGYNKARRSPFA